MANKSVLPLSARCALISLVMAWLPLLGWGGVLKKLDTFARPNGLVELRLVFDSRAPQPKGYSIDKPPRIAIDLANTRSELPKYHDFRFDAVQSIAVLEGERKTRLVISQKTPMRFSSKVDGNLLHIYIGGQQELNRHPSSSFPLPFADQSPQAAAEVAADHSNSPRQRGAVPPTHGITHIDFQRGEAGAGNIIIALSQPDLPMDINVLSGRIQLTFPGNVLPRRLRNRLDVIDFATPVKYIDAQVQGGNTVIVIEPTGDYDYLAYQTNSLLTVSVKPLTKERAEKRQGLDYRGDKLSLNFQDIEVRAVLQIIADFTGMNLVAADTVTGNVTLRLQNVPWDQALDIVLKAKGLDKRLAGNVMTVAPAEELAAREKQQLENEQQIQKLAPVYTDLIQINYAEAKDIATVLAGDEGKSLLTEQGSVQVVERTNSLLIKDTQAKLDEVRALIKELDIPVRQVLIEARVVTLSSNYSKALGVKWTGGATQNNSGRLIVGGGRGTNFNFSGDAINRDGSFNLDNLQSGFNGNNVFTDLSVTEATAAAVGIGFVTNGTLLNLELSALLSDGGGEVISQPKVITADKKTAVIKAGKEIPYTEASSSGAATVAFKDAVLSLEVTPQITPEGQVIMDIKVTNDDTTSSTANGIPIIDKNEIKTQVLVKNGETVVLGGVFKQVQQKRVDKVPLLGDIPYVGALFRKKSQSDNKNELMVFITPRVINAGLSIN